MGGFLNSSDICCGCTLEIYRLGLMEPELIGQWQSSLLARREFNNVFAQGVTIMQDYEEEILETVTDDYDDDEAFDDAEEL
ncbi:hypothetical protein OLMES_4273 [Oleiphilus messinensis]|uniref:Uncharacterized protein n=2 Tax=Oleiphilus messinensis TaxID=141451 RepID=A0A1Y0ICN3_9GAMM|nr:hypothetical protein OLMES_4273 [Oleiphilus messinensis]